MNQETTSEDVKLMRKVPLRMEKFNRGFKALLIFCFFAAAALGAGLVVMYSLEEDVTKKCASMEVEKLTVDQVNAIVDAKVRLTFLRSRIHAGGFFFCACSGMILGMPLILWYRRQSNRVMMCLLRAHLANLEDAADIAAADAAMAEPGKAIPYDEARKDLGLE